MVTEGVNCDTWLFQPPPSCQRQIQQLGRHSWGRDTDVVVSCLRDLTMLAAVSITYVLSLSLWCTCTHTETCIIQSAALKTASINQSLHADLKISEVTFYTFLLSTNLMKNICIVPLWSSIVAEKLLKMH